MLTSQCSQSSLEVPPNQRQQAECICFADSAMIVHVVATRERRSFFMRPPEYIAHCIQCIWRRAGDGRTIIYHIHNNYV